MVICLETSGNCCTTRFLSFLRGCFFFIMRFGETVFMRVILKFSDVVRPRRSARMQDCFCGVRAIVLEVMKGSGSSLHLLPFLSDE